MIIDAATERPTLSFHQEWAGEENLATSAAPTAFAGAGAREGRTVLLGQHRPHDRTSNLAAQLNEHHVTHCGLVAAGFTFSAAKSRCGGRHRGIKLLTTVDDPPGHRRGQVQMSSSEGSFSKARVE